jgi:hypothetical protein
MGPGGDDQVPQETTPEQWVKGANEDFSIRGTSREQIPQSSAHAACSAPLSLLASGNAKHRAPSDATPLNEAREEEDQLPDGIVGAYFATHWPVVSSKIIG